MHSRDKIRDNKHASEACMARYPEGTHTDIVMRERRVTDCRGKHWQKR